MNASKPSAVVIGGGPAGLMAAESLCASGIAVDLYDAMPSLGRKFLMAGKSGLNLTHAEPFADFATRFVPPDGAIGPRFADILAAFPPSAIRAWAANLGVETFVGTSGRVFPHEMKAAPLLRAWLKRLRAHGLRVHVRHRWTGWSDTGALTFAVQAPHASDEIAVRPGVAVLALGGASWPKLGSDGAWVDLLTARGVETTRLRPSNCGFDTVWSERIRERFQGEPLKRVAIRVGDARAGGDCTITATGLEGGPVYTLSATIRDAVERDGFATLQLDLTPDIDEVSLRARLARPSGKTSLANHLRKTVGLSGIKTALVFEDARFRSGDDPAGLAAHIKALPIRIVRPRPIAEAISSAGGIARNALTGDLELRALSGVFVAGEMIDWDAPTGGYLLSGCLATGKRAGEAAARKLAG